MTIAPKLLIVDDRPENLFAIQTLLKEEGLEIHTAQSGNQALALMLRHQFFLVLMDVMMPDMDGFETVEIMNSSEAIRETPVIFLTAIGKDTHHIFKGYAAGAVDYLFKPFDPEILRSKVRVFLKLYRATQEQRRLEQLVERDRSLAALGTLAGGLAHDFNNLLAAIMGFTELAIDDPDLRPATHTHLTTSLAACRRARELIQQIITFSQGGFPIKRTRDVTGLVQSALEAATSGTAIAFHLIALDDMPPVEVDAEQMALVFRHLARNAVESMPEGGQITVTTEEVVDASLLPTGLPPGRYLKITIADQGSGIPQEHLDRIFDPYFSTKPRGAQKGMGLGLAVCQSVVRKHGGQISASSLPGQGTTITLLLPTASPSRLA